MIKAKPIKEVKLLAHKHKHHLERARVISEILGCGFVAMETHIVLFVVVLAVWAVVDIFDLLA